MKGLVIKDLLSLKSSLKTIVVFIVLFGVIGIKTDSSYMVTFASVYAAILPMSCMAFDERCHFNRFAKILPVTDTDMVLSKYITGFILCLGALAITAVIVFIGGGENMAESLLTGLLVPFLYQALLIPMLFKFGVEKARLLILAVLVIPTVLFSFTAEHIDLSALGNAISTMGDVTFTLLLIAVVAVMYLVSMMISIVIYKNKQW